MTSEEIRLECLREAVKMVIHQPTPIGTMAPPPINPLTVAKQFAGFVFGFDWDAENEEYIEPEGDDAEFEEALKASKVRAFDDDGQEL